MSSEKITKISSREKNYFTMIPNVVFDMFTSGIINKNTFAFYALCKRTAGEEGVCFKGRQTLKKQIKCSTREIQTAKEELTKPRDFLNGKSLIILHKQDPGSQYADHIEIEDIWLENVTLYHDKTTRQKFPTLFPGEHPPVPMGTPPCSQGNTKKNTFKKEPIKKDDEPACAGGDIPIEKSKEEKSMKMIVFRHKTKNVVSKRETEVRKNLLEKGYYESEITTALAEADDCNPELRADNHNVIERYLAAMIDKQREKTIKEKKLNDSKQRRETRPNNYQQDLIQRSREGFRKEIDYYGCDAR